MSKVKFQNYSGIKNAKDNPRCIADSDLKNGMSVIYYIADDGAEHVKVAATADDAKTIKHFVWNTIDKPEFDNENDFVIKKGEYARIFEYPQGEIMDISSDLITTASVSIKDIVIASTSGKYVVATESDTGYSFGLRVTEKTTFGGTGFSALVVEQ